jgi:glutaredoxin
MMAKKVVLFGMKNCPHCQTAKQYLIQQNIQYRWCDVRSPAGQKEFNKIGLRGVPVLKIGDQLLNGFSIKRFQQIFNEK